MHDLRVSLLPLEGHRDEHGQRQGWFRFFNPLGELVATAHYRDDLLHGEVVMLQAGQRVAELRYRDGIADGPYRRHVHPGTYCIEGACWEEGAFTAGIPSGAFRLRNTLGAVMFEGDFGRAPTDDEVLCGSYRWGVSQAGDVSDNWFRAAIRLHRDGRVAEGLAAILRGVGTGGHPDVLRDALARVAAPVTPQEADRRAGAVAASGSVRVLLAALVRGAEPTLVLRRLATVTRGPAAPAFLRAAVSLHEWPLSPIVARALRNAAEPQGVPQAVLDDAATLAMSHAEDAKVLCVLASRMSLGPVAHDERGERPTIRRHVFSGAAEAAT